MAEHIAAPLGWSVEDAASAVLAIATENIVGAIREITIAQGIDPREVTIVAGGGASGLNIVPIARELGCTRVLLPSTAGALSACGAMYADIISEFSVSRYAETRRLDFAAVNEALATVEARAAGVPARPGRISTPSRPASSSWSRPATGSRSGSWISRSLASRFESEADVEALEQTFHDTHRRVFAVDEPGQYLECLVWKSRATAVTAKPSVSRPRASRAADGDVAKRRAGLLPRRRATGDARCYSGAHLTRDTVIAGPAIIREPTTTVVVYPGIDGHGHAARQLPAGHRRRAGGRSPAPVRARGGRVMSLDPVLLAVIANRLDTIVREMENTLLRTGRSAVLNMARDFSCALITGDNRLLASAEGLPVHVIGMEFLAEAVTEPARRYPRR